MIQQLVFRFAAVGAIAAALLLLPTHRLRSQMDAAPAAKVRAIWVWKTSALHTSAELSNFITMATAAKITDVYLYLQAKDYINDDAKLQLLLQNLGKAGLRTWGMDGWRGYFSDVEGPDELYAAADAMVAFNIRNPNARFVGFHSDVEPQDRQDVGRNLFHNGLAQGRLTFEQLADRDGIIIEWLDIHARLSGIMKSAGLQYGGAIPSWLDDYFGEPVQAPFRGERKPVMGYLMTHIDQYVIMSYNTSPSIIIDRVKGELLHTHHAESKIMFAVETHAGVGTNVSYADTPQKNSKSAVFRDLLEVDANLSADFPNSYLGWAIHDWGGWRALPE